MCLLTSLMYLYLFFFFFSSRRRHTRFDCDWSSDVCSSDLVIQRLRTQPKRAHAFTWVVDFPLFEPDPETGKPVFAHHPFTSPHPDDLARLDSDPFSCRALHYDAVYNGNELGSGSIRITDAAVQRRV